MVNAIVGAQYNCRKKKRKMRKDVNAKMKVGDLVNIEEFEYEGKPAYMIVDPKSGLDLGVFGAGIAENLAENYPNAEFVAYLEDHFGDTFHVRYCAKEK